MITNKKSQAAASTPDAWIDRSMVQKMSLSFFSRFSADCEAECENGYRVDSEEVVLGYEAGWPLHDNKLH